MIASQDLARIFKSLQMTYFTGVPDSTFKEWMTFLASQPELTNRIAAIERDAVGWAAGWNIATGKIPVVYMQNSGLGNIVNPLTSLTDEEVYKIPLLLMVGWRGEPGTKDEPQHKKMGKLTLPLLDTLGIGCEILPDTADEAEKAILRAVQSIKETGNPRAVIMKSGILEDCQAEKEESALEMSKEEAIRRIVEQLDGSEIIVSTTGKTSRELFEIRQALKAGHQRDFLMVGSMGLASSFAAEIALQKPARKVIVLDGDGALIMSMGVLPTIGFYAPKNLIHIVFDNGSYDSTGGQATVSSVINFERLALASGYKSTKVADKKEDLVLGEGMGPRMIVAKVKKGARRDLGRPTISPEENKNSFIQFVRNI